MASNRKVLVVDDESSVQHLLAFNMEKAGWEVKTVDSGEAALLAVADFDPDLVLLDVMLPGVGGLAVCQQIKCYPKTRGIPVIMLSARNQEADVIAGLEKGADDYITKPFSINVLMAKIDTVLRRNLQVKVEPEAIRIHNLLIDPVRYTVRVDGKDAKLTRNDFRVLHLLASHPGRVFSRQDIIAAAHDGDCSVSDRSVDVQIVGIRRKIGRIVETVRGVGYRLKEE